MRSIVGCGRMFVAALFAALTLGGLSLPLAAQAPQQPPRGQSSSMPQDLMWVSGRVGQRTPGGIVGGYESQITSSESSPHIETSRRDLVICRAAHQNGVHPGRLRREGCSFAWGGQEIIAQNFEYLGGNPTSLRWGAPNSTSHPSLWIPGGREANGAELFMCRGNGEDSPPWPGKLLWGSNNWWMCHIGGQGREIITGHYELMYRR